MSLNKINNSPEERLRLIVEATAAKLGADFFTSTVQHLTKILGVKYAFIGELQQPECVKVSTLAVCVDGQIVGNMTYDLQDTPCKNVIGNNTCIHKKGVQEKFPKDQLLVDMGVISYLGSPLFDGKGKGIGLLVILDTKPLTDELAEFAIPVMEIFAARSAAELARLRSDRALEEREENLRITLNSIGDAVIATDSDGKIQSMNPEAERLTGWRASEAINQPLPQVFKIVNSISREICEDPVAKVMNSRQVVGLANHTVLISKNLNEYQISDSGAPIRNAKNEIVGVVLVFRDVTTEHVLQAQLRHAQKMEAIGQLAGGVAHDFNNMLAGIVGAAELLNLKMANSSNKYLVDLVMNTAARAADLTRKLLIFSRKNELKPEQIDINQVISDTVAILEHSIDKRICIQQSRGASRSIIFGDRDLLQNALLNICLNSRDAMPNGGVLKISTAEIFLDEAYCHASSFTLTPGLFLQMSIEDTGLGISKCDQGRIFEPFYTTKEVGKGTGLGLAAVYGSMTQHRGAIQVESEVNKGTVIHLFFPLIEHPGDIVGGKEVRTVQTPKGAGTILLIDDEELVRGVAQSLLEELGYTVILAENGLRGVEIYQLKVKQIDLVILDVLMPVMNGMDCFTRIKAINPAAKIIMSSGFTKDQSYDEFKEKGAIAFIVKPYSLHHLAQVLQEALAS